MGEFVAQESRIENFPFRINYGISFLPTNQWIMTVIQAVSGNTFKVCQWNLEQ